MVDVDGVAVDLSDIRYVEVQSEPVDELRANELVELFRSPGQFKEERVESGLQIKIDRQLRDVKVIEAASRDRIEQSLLGRGRGLAVLDPDRSSGATLARPAAPDQPRS